MSALSVSRLIRHTRSTRMSPLARLAVTVPLLLWLALAPAVGATAQQVAATPSIAAAAGQWSPATSLAAAPDAPSSQTVTVPGMQTPNGLAVHGINRRIYVTSRDNDMLYMLDPSTFAVLGQTAVGDLPWGVAVDWAANRVYVANFGSANVMVFDSNTLARLATIDMGQDAQPTFVEILPGAHRVFVANHRSDTVAVINSDTNTVEKFVKPGDSGAWGLAVNPNLNQVYVTFRTSATLVTLDAAHGWEPRPGATFQPCGSYPASPYGVAFNQNINKLYLACAPAGGVNTAVVYHTMADGLLEVKRNLIGWGGSNGGGVAVGLGSGSAFFTNSASDTVSIVSYPSNEVTDTEPTGDDPFAVAVDIVGRRVIVGNRVGNSLTVFTDPYLPAAYKVNGVAVNTQNGKVYATSRDNNLLLRLKGNGATDLETFTIVGRRPWGLAVNPRTDRIFVANFDDGAVQMLDGTTMANLGTVAVGGEPTFVEVDEAANHVFTVSHADNKLVVINGASNAIEKAQPTGGSGAFGLAVNTKLNLAYVGHRGSGDIATMNGNNDWRPIESQRISACGAGRTPYAMSFNPANDRLYVACATNDNVNAAVIYRASATGLVRLATLPLQAGGSDGGGGIAVNRLTGNVFFTNSEAGTVTTVNGSDQLAGPATPVGLDPFGIAADPSRGFVYVGLRLGNNVVVLQDSAPPPSTAPRIWLSRQDACEGVQLRVYGAGFAPSSSGRAEVRVDGALVATAGVDATGNFSVLITLPGPKRPGGMRTITATDPIQPALTASATLRTPRTDLPVIFMGGIAGTRLRADREFVYEIPPYNWFTREGEKRNYAWDEEIWLGTRSIDQALFGNDYHFYPLRLQGDGLSPAPDIRNRMSYVGPREPVWELVPPYDQPRVDVYGALFARMAALLTAQGRALDYFGYDWRKDLNVSDPLLDQKIDAVLRATGKDKVVIVAHSMGGMLAREYLLRHGASKIDQVITFGTPYLGSVNPAKYLEMGDTMGMEADPLGIHFELDPEVVKEMARNFGGLYQMLPARSWFNHSPFDGAYDPRYLALAEWWLQEGFLIDYTYWPMDNVRQSYDQTKSYFARNYNSLLVEQGDSFTASGIGDLTRMTDQYINQRIIGTGKPTMGLLVTCQRPCRVCTDNWWNDEYTCHEQSDVPPRPVFNLLGDDTVPVRSAAGNEPLSKMLQDGHYYFVDNAHHMTLGADGRVQDLILNLLQGNICINPGQTLPPGDPGWAVASAALETDYASLGATTGVQMTLVGDGTMAVSDSTGRRLAGDTGLMAGYANTIPGANAVALKGAQVAALTANSAYTVTIRGTVVGGAARLTISDLSSGAMVRSIVFPGLPMTATTTATFTLAGPTTVPDLMLAYQYTPDSPVDYLPGTVLDGPQAGDVTPPAVSVTADPTTGLIAVTAADGAQGSGVVQILYSGETSPKHFVPYRAPFAWPAGAQCVTGLAQDRAGNTGAGQLCRTWLPMLIK